MVTIKNVVLAGATGNLGPEVLKQLVESGKFNVTVFKRKGSATSISLPVKVVEVDYESPENLKSALHGQDAVVSNLNALALEAQKSLIEASIAAGVKRFLPSEFGLHLDDKNETLPVFGNKVKVERFLEEKAATSQLTYTYVWVGAFLDWGIKVGFILDASENKPKIYDGGNTRFSATTLASIGKAVVGVLSHYEETKNRAVRVNDVITTQNQLLAIAKKYTPGKTWEPVPVSLKELVAGADANIAKGIYDMPTLFAYIFVALFDESHAPAFKTTDNELLGIKVLTEAELEDLVKSYLPKN